MSGADHGHDHDVEALIARLDAWDPARGDLPDDLALAMDTHDELRARFDARFARWVADDDRAEPEEVNERLLASVAPRRARWRGWTAAGLGVSALAAAAMALATLSPALRPPETERVDAAANSGVTVPQAGGQAGQQDDVFKFRTATDAWRRDGDLDPGDGKVAGAEHLRHGTFTVDPNTVVTLDARLALSRLEPLPMGGWTVAAAAPRSTFAIDVDRGSYTLARGRLRSGALPDPETVRVEEFVNALRYDDPAPDDGRLAVQLAATDSPFGDGRILVRVGLKAATPPVRTPVHLTFLVDTSGSMSPADRLPLVKQALELLVGVLGPEDTVAIVTYAGSAGVALPPTAAANRAPIHAAIASLTASGGTAMGAGLDLAYALASDAHRLGHTSRVIAASDGDANVGVTDTATLSARIRGYADQGITLTTLGFGNGGYQDARMEQLADDGDGNYYYVDGLDEARRVFVDELASTVQVVARDVKLQVEWNPDAVARYRLLGYENRALRNDQFRDDAVDAGEVGAGHSVTALYVAELVPGRAGPIATARVRSKAPDAPLGDAVEAAVSLPREAVAPAFDQAAPDLRMAVVAAVFAERLRGSPYVAGIDLARVEAMGRAAARRGHPEDAELVDLVHRAAALEAHRP